MCPVKDCGKVLPQPPALRLHMVKVHKIIENCKDDQLLHRRKTPSGSGETVCYKCPVAECIYNGPRHFTLWKCLKQHYMKVHAEKKFCCETCDVKFGLRADLKRHMTLSHGNKGKEQANKKQSGVGKQVCDRDALAQSHNRTDPGMTPSPWSPPTRAATLCVQVKPPNHEQMVPLLSKPNIVVMAVTGREGHGQQNRLIYIADTLLPRPTLPRLAPKPGLIDTADIARQTDVNTQTLVTFSEREADRDWWPAMPHSRRYHSSTQTLAVKRKHNVAQTQTTGDFILRRAMRSANIPIRKASTGCQMSPVTEPTGWCGVDTDDDATQTLVPRAAPRQRNTTLIDVVCPVSVGQPTVTSVDAACGTWDVSPRGSTWDLPLPETMSTLTSKQLDTETQTMVLLEELHASLAESISTQTFESFLETAVTTPTYLEERPQNSTQTQTRHSVLSPAPCLIPSDSLCHTAMTVSAPDPLFGGCSTDDLDLSGKYLSQSNLVSTTGQQGAPLLADNFDFLNTESQTGDLDPDYMHMETQTSIEDIFDQLLSNMETQTSDDVFGDMEFSDIHTQTTMRPEPSSSFDSSSTETQTSLHTLVQSTNMTEFSNTETQTLFTGIDFSTTLADSHTQTTWSDLESFI